MVMKPVISVGNVGIGKYRPITVSVGPNTIRSSVLEDKLEVQKVRANCNSHPQLGPPGVMIELGCSLRSHPPGLTV